jgi:hypothetical protein
VPGGAETAVMWMRKKSQARVAGRFHGYKRDVFQKRKADARTFSQRQTTDLNAMSRMSFESIEARHGKNTIRSDEISA